MILNSAHPIYFGRQRILTMTAEQDLPTVCDIRNARLWYVYVHTRSNELLVVIYDRNIVSPKIMLCGLSFRVLRRRLRGALLKVIVRSFQRSQETYFGYRDTFGGPHSP